MDRALKQGKLLVWVTSHRFAFGAIAAIASRLAAAGLTFVLGIVLARVLGYSAYGEYAFVLAIVQLITIVSKFGLDNAALRFAAEYRAKNSHGALLSFLGDTKKINISVSGGIAALFACGTCVLRAQMHQGVFLCCLVGAILLAILPVVQVREATLVALGKVTQSLIGPVVTPAIFIVYLLASRAFMPTNSSSSAAMFLHVLAALTGLVIASIFLTRSVGSVPRGEVRQPVMNSEWRSMAFSMMVVNVLIYIQGQSGTIFSGVLLGTEQAGLFSVATRISGASLLGLSSINMIAAPRMAALYAKQDRHGLQRLAKHCAWGSLAFSLPVVALTAIYGRVLLQYFGPEFVQAHMTLLLLLVGLIINSSTGAVAHLLYMTGNHSTCLQVYGVFSVVTVLLHLSLIPSYGILGAAVTTTIVQAAWNSVLVYYVRKKVGIWSLIGVSDKVTFGSENVIQ
ncbi:MAG: oligosaccharide flippase family protein [Planctomycetota bacterium]